MYTLCQRLNSLNFSLVKVRLVFVTTPTLNTIHTVHEIDIDFYYNNTFV